METAARLASTDHDIAQLQHHFSWVHTMDCDLLFNCHDLVCLLDHFHIPDMVGPTVAQKLHETLVR